MQFRAMVDSISDSIYFTDYDSMRFLYVNKAAAEQTGYTQQDLLKMGPENIINQNCAQIRSLYDEAIAAGEEGTVTEAESINKEGVISIAEIRQRAVCLDDHWIIISISQDISSRKRSEKELQEAHDELESRVEEQTKEINSIKEEFAHALRIANLGQWRFDEVVNEYLMVSEEYAQIFGYTTDEFLSRFKSMEDGLTLVHPEDQERVAATYINNDSAEIEYRIVRADGLVRWVHEINMVSLDELGSSVESWGTLQDITELKEAQIAAEAANRGKSSFMATMNHELRTPLNGIIGMIELLRQGQISGEQKPLLQSISESGESLLTIINDILDFSKIESGKLNLEAIPMSLLDNVEGAIQALAASATKKGLRLISYVDPELPQFVIGDPARIRQIIINLVSNAIKFTEEGMVVVQLETLCRGTDDTLTIRLSVRDQGIGISEEDQSKLFEAFIQAEDSTSRRYGGTGLGLLICKMLTELMGGKIGVNSKMGEGAEFYIELPFTISDQLHEVRETTNLSGLRILLVNNNSIEQKIFSSYLEYWQISVDLADDVSGTLDRCRRGNNKGTPYDVVIFGPQWSREELISISDACRAAQLNTRFIFLLDKTSHRIRAKENKKGIFLDVNSLRRAELISSIAIAAGLESPEVQYEDVVEGMKSTRKALTVEEARKQGTLILVAEDNATNRDIIGRQFTLLGYTCEMAEDGKIALDAWRRNGYAMLFTDCNMPNMDGIELTRVIRQDEENSGHHAKIVAITANVLEGEAERCLAYGMDDFLSKPMKLAELKRILEKWMPQAHTERPTANVEVTDGGRQTNTATHTSDGSPIDDTTLKSTFGDDSEVFKQILSNFVKPTNDIIQEIKSACISHSAEAIKQGAHKLKSAAYSIGANQLGDLCKDLESAGVSDNWDVIDAGMPKLERKMSQVEEYIANL